MLISLGDILTLHNFVLPTVADILDTVAFIVPMLDT
jgi:hypothetical protein